MDIDDDCYSRRLAYQEIMDDYEAFFGYPFRGANYRAMMREMEFWISEGWALLNDTDASGRIYYNKLCMVLNYVNVYLDILLKKY